MKEQDGKQPGPRERQGPGAMGERVSDSRQATSRDKAELGVDELLSDASDPLQRAHSRRKLESERR